MDLIPQLIIISGDPAKSIYRMRIPIESRVLPHRCHFPIWVLRLQFLKKKRPGVVRASMSLMGCLKISTSCLMNLVLRREHLVFCKRNWHCTLLIYSTPVIRTQFIFMRLMGTFPVSPCFPENQLAWSPVKTLPTSRSIYRMSRRVM